ncbi:hypothetical protein [Caudovirales GX15bay]|nr:hypothetical protein [Caudovirales GX15bay]
MRLKHLTVGCAIAVGVVVVGADPAATIDSPGSSAPETSAATLPLCIPTSKTVVPAVSRSECRHRTTQPLRGVPHVPVTATTTTTRVTTTTTTSTTTVTKKDPPLGPAAPVVAVPNFTG